MKPKDMRRIAAFFMCWVCGCGWGMPQAMAAPRPPSPEPPPPKNTNLNQESRPVILKRNGDPLPDISDIFGGYDVDELPSEIPIIAVPVTPPRPKDRVSEEGLLILELRLGRHILQDALLGYSERGMLLLPIGQLAEALQFPITLNLDTRRAEGWFSDEDKSFLFDARNARITLAGKVDAVDAARFDVRDDDIYVDSALLGAWFSLDFNFSMSEQVVSVAGRNDFMLPVERLAARETAREQLKLKRSDGKADFPLIREPYHLATMPFADIYASSHYDGRGTPSSRHEASVLMNGDALYMHQNSFVSYGAEGGIREARMTLSRKDPEGKIFASDDALADTWLGQFANGYHITDVTFGDMVSAQTPLTMLNQNGRGVMVSNQPLNRADRFDRTTIRGDIQPDWDVELYRNDELLAFQRSTSNGRYEFDDVPLLSGLNLIRLVFYGPFGQTREEIRRVLVNPNITKKGESYMRFMAMEQGESLIGVGTVQSAFSANLQPGLNPALNTNTQGRERFALEYEYGMLDHLALYAQATQTPITASDETRAMTLGMGGVWQDIFARVDVAHADNGGNAAQITTQTNLYGVNLSLEHQRYQHFFSDFTEDVNDPVVRRSIARADGSVKLPILPRFSIGVSAARTDYDSGQVRDELTQRTTTSLFGTTSLNHTLYYTRDRSAGATPVVNEQTRGNVLVSVPAFGAFLRGTTTYGLKPEMELHNVALALDYSFSEDLIARGEVFRQFSGDATNSFTTSLTRRFEQFALGVSIGADDKGNKQAGISLNFAVGSEPRTGKIRAYADPASSSGVVATRTFIDHDHNKIFGEGDEVLHGTRYLVNGGSGGRHSQDIINGVQLVKYLPTDEPTVVTVNPSSLEDPFLVAGNSGVRVIARSGVPVVVDFPVEHAADVEGLVMMRRGGELLEAANVKVEAVNEQGEVIRTAQTAFDGIYVLELVPAGAYTIRISAEQSKRLGFKKTTSKKLKVSGDEEYLQDVDLKIEP